MVYCGTQFALVDHGLSRAQLGPFVQTTRVTVRPISRHVEPRETDATPAPDAPVSLCVRTFTKREISPLYLTSRPIYGHYLSPKAVSKVSLALA